MTTYEITYVNNKGHQNHISVIATDVRHAISQALELKPECRVISYSLNLCGLTMKHTQSEMEATQKQSLDISFQSCDYGRGSTPPMTEIQYKRKPPTTRLILCSSLNDVYVGEPVMIVYHCGMRAYKHNRHVVVSSERNCFGGFYYTDGTEA